MLWLAQRSWDIEFLALLECVIQPLLYEFNTDFLVDDLATLGHYAIE